MFRGFFVLVAMLWLSGGVSIAAPESKPAIELSEEQRKFISDHRPIRVGITPEWSPFSYFTPDGHGAGLDVDLLNLISERTGLKFEIVPGEPSWDEIWRMAQEGEVDLTTSTVKTVDREKTLRFTRPYAESMTVIVARGGDLRFRHLTLLRDVTVAQPKKHLVTMELRKRSPDTRLILLDTQSDCFEYVARGKADAAVADMFTATQYLNDNPHLKLGISGVISDFKFPLSLGVRSDYPVLVEILDQTLATVSQEELDEMISRHLMFTLQAGQRVALLKKRLAYVVVSAAAFAGIFVIWNCLIRKEMLARRKAEAELRDSNRSLEIFSHSIAHDLRTPLRAISGLSEALEQDYGGKLDNVGLDYIGRINSAACRMESLVRDVLAYSQATRAEFSIGNVSLKQVIHQLLGEFPPGQRGYFQVLSELPTVKGHPALLAQSLSNLFANALKFMPEGRTPEIRIWAEQVGPMVRLWVEDNGIGIAPEEQQSIFEIFKRGSHSYGGTGIGLAVVSKALERMNGRVGVESKVNEGSRFWIELPNGDPETPAAR